MLPRECKMCLNKLIESELSAQHFFESSQSLKPETKKTRKEKENERI